MKIGIDARMYGPGQGGLGRYMEQLILHLEKQFSTDPRFRGDDNEIVVFLRRENWDLYQPKNPRFKKVLADVPWYGWREQIILPIILGREKVDLMHFPHWNVPILYGCKFIVTIHDLLLLEFPTQKATTLGPIKYFFKSLAYKIVLKHAAKKSQKIITVSEFSKQDIVKKLGVVAEKIAVTYLAPTANCHSCESRNLTSHTTIPTKIPAFAGMTGDNAGMTGTKKNDNLGINRPFVLYVGVAYPHKNLERLLRVWKTFCATYGSGWQLVLAGKRDYFYDKIQNTWKKIQGDDSVVFTGFVSDEELENLYKNASLLVMPSLYEGFGLPPLEAMRHGVPVASSNRSSLPEILQDAVIYFDPENEQDMAQAIHTGLTDENTRKKLIAAGQKLYPTYSWLKTAEQTLKTYQSCG